MHKIFLVFILFSTSLFSNTPLLSDIFTKRHSGTNFIQTPLTEEQINALVESARCAPSSYNDQPWNFIFCDRYSNEEAYFKALDAIYDQDWGVEEAPLLVITVVRPYFLHNGCKNDWAEYDTGAAALSMSLLAADIGLMAHQIGGFDREQIQEEFDLPEGYVPLSIIAIGYEDNEKPREKRQRRPIEENFFEGEWGRSIKR